MTDSYDSLLGIGEDDAAVPEHLTRSLDVAIVTAGRVFGVAPKYPYRFRYSDEEADAGFVPGLRHAEVAEITEIIIVRDWLNSYIGDFCVENPEVTNLDMLKVAVASSVIPDMLLEEVDPYDKGKVDGLYSYFSSPVAINSLIADDLLHIGKIEVYMREEVLSWPEEKICELNRYRLVVGALYYNESDAGQEVAPNRQQVDMASRVRNAFRDKFEVMDASLDNYVQKMKAMLNADENRARRQFISGITPLELALAYPMGYAELSKYAEVLHNK